MRFLFFLILLANLFLLGYGQGFFGAPPSEQGREPRQLLQENNQQAIALEPPLDTTQVAR
jgi:hypothetical protein